MIGEIRRLHPLLKLGFGKELRIDSFLWIGGSQGSYIPPIERLSEFLRAKGRAQDRANHAPLLRTRLRLEARQLLRRGSYRWQLRSQGKTTRLFYGFLEYLNSCSSTTRDLPCCHCFRTMVLDVVDRFGGGALEFVCIAIMAAPEGHLQGLDFKTVVRDIDQQIRELQT